MTFEELLYAFFDRGFSDVEAYLPRARRWLNQSYLAICESYPWPFLEKDAPVGPAPLTIEDMRAILSVNDTVTKIKVTYIDRRTLTDWVTDLSNGSAVGNPFVYYLEGQTVKTYPVLDNPLAVRYLYVPPWMVEDTDEPVIPERFQELIVDGAVIKGYRDLDNYEAMNSLRQEYNIDLQGMAASLMVRNESEPTRMVYYNVE